MADEKPKAQGPKKLIKRYFTEREKPEVDPFRGLYSGKESKVAEALANQTALLTTSKKKLEAAVEDLSKLGSEDSRKKYEEALQDYIDTAKTFARSISNTSSLKEYAISLEKATSELQETSTDDSIKAIQAQLKAVTRNLEVFSDKSGEVINKIISGLLTQDDIDAFYKVLEQQAKVKGLSKDQLQKLKADLGKMLVEAKRDFQKGNQDAAVEKGKEVVKKIQTSLREIEDAVLKRLSNTEKYISEKEAKNLAELEKLDAAGKGDSLVAKLRRQGLKKTLGQGIQGVQKNQTLGNLTGGATSKIASSYVTGEGSLDLKAIQSKLISNLADIGTSGFKAYQKYGSEFGAMDRGFGGHLAAGKSYVSHESDMAMVGLKTGRTGAEAGQAFDQVATSMRVGTADVSKRKEELNEMTKVTLRLSTATGVSETKIISLSKAYRDNLGKSAKEASEAGFSVARALNVINRDLKDDLKISGSQIQEIFQSLASDSSSFGSDIKEMNFQAERSANYFAKMGVNATKAKQTIEDIVKLKMGNKTLGAGITTEIAWLGTENLKGNRSKIAQVVGGEDKLDEMSKLGATDFAMELADKYEKAGKTEVAKRIREKSFSTKGASDVALKAAATNNEIDLLALQNNKEALGSVSTLRGDDLLADELGMKTNSQVEKEKYEKIKSSGLNVDMAEAAGGLSTEERWLATHLRRGTKDFQVPTPEQQKQDEEKVKQAVDDSGGGLALSKAILDPKSTLNTALEFLSKNVLANTAALIANTFAIGGKGLGNLLPSGLGTGGGALPTAGGAAGAAAGGALPTAAAAGGGKLAAITGAKTVGQFASKAALPLTAIMASVETLNDAIKDPNWIHKSWGSKMKGVYDGTRTTFSKAGDNFKKGEVWSGIGNSLWGATQAVLSTPHAIVSTSSHIHNKALDTALNTITRSDASSVDNQMQAQDLIRALRSKTGKTKKYDFSNMSPEAREKKAKELEGNLKDLREAETSWFSPFEKWNQRNLQDSIKSLTSLENAPLPNKNIQPAQIQNPAEMPGSERNPLQANMKFQNGTNKIVFEVKDASDVMAQSFNNLFRNNTLATG